MANESRPRTSFPSWPLPTDEAGAISAAISPNLSFHYTPLDQKIEEFRILILHPKRTDSLDEPIHCSLSHTTFGKRPSYEALSYTWGDQAEPFPQDIKVNGVSILVGLNLGSALAQLRLHKGNRNLWVDAICINQMDNEEKSSQIPLMPFIYMRAQKCLIWLMPMAEGSTEVHDNRNQRGVRSGISFDGRALKRFRPTLYSNLVKNPYWLRVWIIQEVGSARKLLVLYEDQTIEWKDFIQNLRQAEGFADCIPLKLQQQIDDKYSAGHSLQHLIESHQSSLCQDPRDRIYGFVGLANDAQDFPINYSKSIYEVWKDTVLFKAASRTTNNDDIVVNAFLILNLLGGLDAFNHHEPLSDLKRRSGLLDEGQHTQPTLLGPMIRNLPEQVLIPSQSCGQVAYIGPSWTEMVSFPRKTIEWRLSINKYIADSERPRVRKESDNFMHMLELLDNKEAEAMNRLISDSEYSYPWERLSSDKQPLPELSPRNVSQQRHESLPEELVAEGKHKSYTRPEIADPRLFLLNQESSNRRALPYAASVGLVPPGTSQGDYICQVDGFLQAFVVRRAQESFKIIGTATLAQTSRLGKERRLPFERADCVSIDPKDRLDLSMDIARLFQLLAGAHE